MLETQSLPLSAHELRDAVRNGRSFDPARLDRVLRQDTARGLVEVQASTPWKNLAAQLRPGDTQAAAVRTTLPTVGESIAWNAAGPDGRPAVTHVESLTVITPDGELRRVNRIANRELFALLVGGHGLFGTLYSVTLRIESLQRAINEAAAQAAASAPEPAKPARRLHLLVPPENLEGFEAHARALCAEWRIAIDGVETRNIQQEEETFLRWARRQYAEISLRLAEPATIGAAVRTGQLCRELIDAAIARGGSFEIARTPEATRAQVEACYPELPAFLAEKRRIDPLERLVNGWYRHYRSLLGRRDCEVRWAS